MELRFAAALGRAKSGVRQACAAQAEEKNAVEESGETSAAQQVASGGPSCSGSSQPGATAAAGGGDGPASSAQPSPSSSVAAAASQSASAPASTSLKLPFNIQAAAAAAREALEKAKKAAELQRQIQEQLRQRQLGGVGAAVPLAAPQPVSAVAAQTAPVTAAASAAAAITGADPLLQQQLLLLQREAQQLQLRKQRELEQEKALLAKARPLRFDRFGREVDAEGRLVEVKPVLHSSLKINQRQRQEKLQQVRPRGAGQRTAWVRRVLAERRVARSARALRARLAPPTGLRRGAGRPLRVSLVRPDDRLQNRPLAGASLSA